MPAPTSVRERRGVVVNEQLTAQRPRRATAPLPASTPRRDPLADPVLLPERHVAAPRQWEPGVGACESLERLERAAAGDLERARGRHGAGGRRRARGHGEGVELRGRVRGRGEDAGRVRARAAEDGVFERGELRLLVPDVVLEGGDVLADGNCVVSVWESVR